MLDIGRNEPASLGGGGNRLSGGHGKRRIPVTLICVDTTQKVHLAERAIRKCKELADFDDIKLLTTDTTREHAVKIRPVNGIEDYSVFVVRELHNYFNTSHCLLVQWDGYLVNAHAWENAFLNYDYIGAPWPQWNTVGNGGFSLRSKRLCELLAGYAPNETPHPEDSWISHRHRPGLERAGVRFAPTDLAGRFAFEGRSWNGKGWEAIERNWTGQFGFHSWLTPLPQSMDKPLIFHHSGDAGDIIYSLASVKAMGGGMYFISPDCKYPFPQAPRMARLQQVEAQTANISPLLEAQDYIWHCAFTHGLPFSTDADFNKFRAFYQGKSQDNFASLYSLHAKAFGLTLDETEPWLTVPKMSPIGDKPIIVNRTARFQNTNFPWFQLVNDYGHLMAFVGTEAEYNAFCVFGPKPVRYEKTANLLDLAQVIAGAKIFIGNQSTPMAIALGLGKNSIQECWRSNPNCILKRSNVLYWREEYGQIRLPETWLR